MATQQVENLIELLDGYAPQRKRFHKRDSS